MSAADVCTAHAVLICCKAHDAFRRAHIWALNRKLTSLLLTPADWPKATAISAQFEAASVVTDEPACPYFSDARVVDAASLPSEQPAFDAAMWPDPVAILFTSGSTGEPKPVTKDARAILGEFKLLEAWFRDAALPPMTEVITTVPLEHMFGYTFAHWLPLLMKVSLQAKRPVLPNDLKRACAAAKSPVWVITTPTHLRAYAQLPGGFDHVAGVVCATSPLSSELARAAAASFRAPIVEIYGSTESGAVAARLRTVGEQTTPGWTPLPGVGIQRGPAGTAICRIPHVGVEVELSDLIDMDGPGFHVAGRAGDLVKIGGKRHSLAALNHLLTSVPGVRDGVYFIPPVDPLAQMQRGAAFVVLSEGFCTSDVVGNLRDKMDDVFLPRPIHAVNSLPRTDAGKLRDADLQRMLRSFAPSDVLQPTGDN